MEEVNYYLCLQGDLVVEEDHYFNLEEEAFQSLGEVAFLDLVVVAFQSLGEALEVASHPYLDWHLEVEVQVGVGYS